ncbi:MAG: MFS transporter [Crenarchaeota archaeon]|nr:MFS transporter [Thermoproteota archaeon]
MAGDAGRALLLVFAAVFAAGVAAGLSRVALAKYLQDDLAAGVVAVSALTSLFMAPRAVSALLGGVASDALGERAWRLMIGPPMLLISLLVYLTSLTRSIPVIMALNALWGLLSGLVWPATQVATSLAAGRGRSSTAMSIYFAVAFLGMTIGQGVYGVLPLGNPETLRLSSLAFASSGLLLVAASRRLPRGLLPRRRGGLASSLVEAVRAGAAWILLAAFASGYMSALLREFLVYYLSDRMGYTREMLGSTLLAAGLASFAIGLAVGPLADRLGVAAVLTGVLLMGAAGGLLLAVAASPLAVAAGIALAQASSRSSLPLTRNAALFPAAAATLVGASNTASNLGQVVSPLVGGALYEALRGRSLLGVPGEATPFLTASLLSLLVAATRPRRGRGGRG